VRPETLAEHGAVSERTVIEMSVGALAASGADRAVAISGVAGPDGGTAQNPVGSVWFAIALRIGEQADIRSLQRCFEGDRDAIRRQAVAAALQLFTDL
jgi:nicotinamide-nucleotide amidase